MLEQIESDYARAITLRTMSESIGRHPAHLSHLFHEEVGSSPREYLARVRLEHAVELIRDGVKIEAVAMIVGYRSKKNFYRRFKRYFGTTPVRYRGGSRVGTSGDRCLAAADALCTRDAKPAVSASEPALSRLASIVRESDHAWRLAVRAQKILRQQFTRSPVGMLLTNDGGTYVGANRAAASVTGYSMTELHDLSPGDLFVTAPRAETRCVWQLVVSPYRPDRPSNAMVRTKAGDSVGVHLVTLKHICPALRVTVVSADAPRARLSRCRLR